MAIPTTLERRRPASITRQEGRVPGDPHDFEYVVQRGGDVVITHHGKRATVLRGPRALEFVGEVEAASDEVSAQQVMARWTGNYKRGNERAARQHPRNRGR
jgi:hypothetical protein